MKSFDIILASLSENNHVNLLKLKERIRILKKDYDFILIDSSPALNEETLAVMLASDKLLVVTTPDYPTLKVTMKAIAIAKKREMPIIGIIINKHYGKKFELSISDIERMSGVPVMAVIPHDISMLEAVAEFTPSTSFKPKSKASIEYRKLAAALIGEKYKPFKIRNLFRFNPKREDVNREIYYRRVFR